jgi:hypothetical protein
MTGAVSETLFFVCFALGGAAVALWLVARYPELTPAKVTSALLHVGAALLVGKLIAPAAIVATGGLESAGWTLMRLFGMAFAPLVYLLVATAWLIKTSQAASGLR